MCVDVCGKPACTLIDKGCPAHATSFWNFDFVFSNIAVFVDDGFYCSQICLEMLYFANYSGDTDSSIVRETWARLMDQALSRGGIAEACAVLKRVGSHVYPGDGAVLPLDTLCLHLEKAALVPFFFNYFLVFAVMILFFHFIFPVPMISSD